jgi:predicted MFS family arabinose efflux permease
MVLAGFKYLVQQPSLFFLVLLAGMVSLAVWPFLSLLPALASEVLGGSERYSAMVSATGCGALVAALVSATFGSPRRQHAFMAVAIFLMALGLMALSLATNLLFAILDCALIGFGLILFFATTQSAVQLGAAEHNRGRVLGIWAMVMSGAVPVGNLICGPAGDRWGEPVVLFSEGVACILCSLALWAFFRLVSRRSAS